jgi:glycosyltransferase involved in cell wall biosynthesis
VVFVGFYGYLLIYLVRLLSRRPVIFDAYLSTYNTLCYDRKRFTPGSPIGRLVFWMDKLACTIADIVVLDTRAHRDYFVKTYGLPADKFAVLYLGCDEELFFPRPAPRTDGFNVFYYGSFLPLQGIEYIVQAASLLAGERDIRFEIAGQGMRYAEIRALAESLACTNINFVEWIPYVELPDHIASASICLGGHFSDSNKAQNVIATKTYQFLAMAKPTIVGDCRANSEIMTHGEHVYMCRMADARSLAEAILALRANPSLREKIATGGYLHFIERYSTPRIGSVLFEIIDRVAAPAVP